MSPIDDKVPNSRSDPLLLPAALTGFRLEAGPEGLALTAGEGSVAVMVVMTPAENLIRQRELADPTTFPSAPSRRFKGAPMYRPAVKASGKVLHLLLPLRCAVLVRMELPKEAAPAQRAGATLR